MEVRTDTDMSVVHIDNEENEDNSLSSGGNSDDDIDNSRFYAHRSCSRYGSCNSTNHQHLSIDSRTRPCLSKTSASVKGQIRPMENDPGHQQKYDGTRWRRICCVPDCKLYLNGGVYFENWLCRKHYLLTIANDGLTEPDYSPVRSRATVAPKTPKSAKTVAAKLSKNTESHKRGDLKVNANGNRHKYDGRTWRPVCTYTNCISFIVRHGYCLRHYVEMRKKPLTTPTPSKNTPQKTSKKPTSTARTKTSTAIHPKKGDIQMVRQLWNGTKWYSLCHYYTRECTRRSSGKKYGFLCDMHYKEYLAKQKDPSLIDHDDQILISPTVKRKKLINDDESLSSIFTDRRNNRPSVQQSQSTINDKQHIEQCIQTDVTCPLESVDLRQGCILIDDDDANGLQQSEPSPQIICLKKEEDYIITKRKTSPNVNVVPFECKIELTKLEV